MKSCPWEHIWKHWQPNEVQLVALKPIHSSEQKALHSSIKPFTEKWQELRIQIKQEISLRCWVSDITQFLADFFLLGCIFWWCRWAYSAWWNKYILDFLPPFSFHNSDYCMKCSFTKHNWCIILGLAGMELIFSPIIQL